MGLIDPPRGFVRELKALSKNLDCHFDDTEERFIITYMRPIGEPIAIYMIKNEDGSFRRPAQCDLDLIATSDTHKANPDERAKAAAKYFEDYQAKLRRNATDDFRNRTKDDKYQLVRQFAGRRGDASKIHPFRKLGFKPKGKVF